MTYGIAVVTLDRAVGRQLGNQNAPWTVEGQVIVGIGDLVEAHEPFVPLHSPPPPMVEGSDWMTIDGIPVCREENKAACGHPTTGRPWFTLPS